MTMIPYKILTFIFLFQITFEIQNIYKKHIKKNNTLNTCRNYAFIQDSPRPSVYEFIYFKDLMSSLTRQLTEKDILQVSSSKTKVLLIVIFFHKNIRNYVFLIQIPQNIVEKKKKVCTKFGFHDRFSC